MASIALLGKIKAFSGIGLGDALIKAIALSEVHPVTIQVALSNGAVLRQGDTKQVWMHIRSDSVNLVGATLRFILAEQKPRGDRLHLLTKDRASGDIEVIQESSVELIARCFISLPSMSLPELGRVGVWTVNVNGLYSQAGEMQLLPSLRKLVVLQGAIASTSTLGGAL